MRWDELLLGSLAAWRITHLFAAEDGPGDVLARLRRRAGHGLWGKLLDCFYCLSLWAAAPLAWQLGRGASSGAVLWLALSAGAIVIERLTGTLAGGNRLPMPIYHEDSGREDGHDLLRQSEKPGGGEPNGSAAEP